MNKFIIFLFCITLCFSVHADEISSGRNSKSVQLEKSVKFNDQYFFGNNGFFQTGDNLQVQKLEEAVLKMTAQLEILANRVKEQDETIRLLKREVEILKSNGQSNSGLIPPPFNDDDIEITPPSSNEAALQVLINRCAVCHRGENARDNFKILESNNSLANLSKTQLRLIRDTVVATDDELRDLGLSRMPLNGQQLPQNELNIIKNWVNERLR